MGPRRTGKIKVHLPDTPKDPRTKNLGSFVLCGKNTTVQKIVLALVHCCGIIDISIGKRPDW